MQQPNPSTNKDMKNNLKKKVFEITNDLENNFEKTIFEILTF